MHQAKSVANAKQVEEELEGREREKCLKYEIKYL